MRGKEAKALLVSVIEDDVSGELLNAHGERITLHPETQRGCRALEELRQQTILYDATFHLIDEVIGLRKRNEGCELRRG